MDLPIPETPLSLTRPARQTVPIVFASAHSGRAYPPAFLAALVLIEYREQHQPVGIFVGEGIDQDAV